MQLGLDSDVLEINQIGEQRVKKLHNLGIYTVKGLVEHFPRDYDDRSNVKKINELTPNEMNTFRGRIKGVGENIRIKNMIMTRVKIYDETGQINGVWYNQPYMKNTFFNDSEYIFTGKLAAKYNKKEIQSPEYEKIKEGEILSGGRIIPMYHATNGLSQKILRTLIKDTLEKTESQLYDFLPIQVRKKYKLCDRNFAIQNIHFPEDNESFFIARKRLVFEELFMLQASLLKIKSAFHYGKTGLLFRNIECCEELISELPFLLTNAQKNVFEEIKKDLTSGKVMNRLVQGDVGSGKTAVAMLAAYLAIKNGYQTALMVPTEVLANQHFEAFEKLFESLGIKTVLLSGSLKKKEKNLVLDDICSGEAQMIIGTHAVIQKTVTFRKLGLVITDEQHRFGVRQRGTLAEKGDNPHVLVMTATPIPRTLALILYGDLDISIIDELPPGRQRIDTSAVPASYHERIYEFIKKEIDKGRQAYIICPMIDESDKLDVQAVTSYTELLKNETFRDYSVACLHGKMKPNLKQEIMDSFLNGDTKILVSTTVIEVGINVPNSTIMLIENAERFGLAQLHQLRGRVGRGAEKSYCILVCDSKNNVANQRMKVMQNSNDGFEISETDLKLRGPGEFFGTRQHGLPEMKIANLYKDIEILKEAQSASQELMENDPDMEQEENRLLKIEMNHIFDTVSISI